MGTRAVVIIIFILPSNWFHQRDDVVPVPLVHRSEGEDRDARGNVKGTEMRIGRVRDAEWPDVYGVVEVSDV